MLGYLIRRLILALFTIVAISILSFAIIQLPPGDYVDAYIAQMSASGSAVSAAGSAEPAHPVRTRPADLRPVPEVDAAWSCSGNFGMAMEWGRPVTDVIGDRLALTMVVSIAALMLTWVLALPIGIYSAMRQYSIGDYVFTFLGFIGLAVPSFLLALLVLYFGFTCFDANIGGLFSPEYLDAPWSWAKLVDLLGTCRSRPSMLGLAGTGAGRSASCAPTCSTSCASRTS